MGTECYNKKVIAQYFAWHYGRGLKAALGLSENAVEFALHIWSIRELFSSLFSPWKQIVVPHQRTEALSVFFTAAWYNFLSRIIGASVRLVAIGFGLVHAIIMGGIAVVILVFWVLGPFLPALFLIAALAILV